MHLVKKSIIFCCLFCCLLCCANPWAFADLFAKSAVHLECNGELISVDINQAPLKDVLSQLKVQNGIWFQGDDTLLNHKVTTRFEKMVLIEGLKKILLSINHAMIFDKTGTLRGIVLVKAGQNGSLPTQKTTVSKNDALHDPEQYDDQGDQPRYPEKWVPPDQEVNIGMKWPAEKPPTPEKMAKEGPGAGKPSKKGPDADQRPPAHGPGSDPPKFVTTP
jgi:hypothetical protein